MKIPLRLIGNSFVVCLKCLLAFFNMFSATIKLGIIEIGPCCVSRTQTVLLKVLNRAYFLNEIILVIERNFCFCQENGCHSDRIM